MGLGEDVGVDAQGDAGFLAELCCAFGEELQLAFALHVEEQDAGAQGEVDLGSGLADSGEDNAVGGRLVDSNDALELSSGDNVEARTFLMQELENGKRGVGLDGIADEVRDGRRLAEKGFGEKLEPVEKMVGGVDVERGAVLFREGVERDFSAGEWRAFAGMDEGADWSQAASGEMRFI